MQVSPSRRLCYHGSTWLQLLGKYFRQKCKWQKSYTTQVFPPPQQFCNNSDSSLLAKFFVPSTRFLSPSPASPLGFLLLRTQRAGLTVVKVYSTRTLSCIRWISVLKVSTRNCVCLWWLLNISADEKHPYIIFIQVCRVVCRNSWISLLLLHSSWNHVTIVSRSKLFTRLCEFSL